MGPILALVLESPAIAQAVEEETTSSNPILPVGNELFWAAVTFALLWILMKYVLLPPVMRGIEARATKVREDLEAADAASTDADRKLQQYEGSLVTAKAEAVRIVEDARNEAEAGRRELVAVAEADVAAQRAEAAQEIAEAKARAKADLQASVAGIAVEAAEAVMQKQLDRQAQTQVIEDYVNRAGSPN